MMRYRALAVTLGLGLACTAPGRLAAQASARDVFADSATSRPPVQQNVWVSGGIGSGGARGSGLAGVVSGWYAYGPFVAGARYSEGGPWFGPSTHERAALVGVRARSKHAFILAGAGGGMMGGWRSNGEQSGTRTVSADAPSFALGAEAAVTYEVIGIGVDVFGATARGTPYSGVALSVQLGYLH